MPFVEEKMGPIGGGSEAKMLVDIREVGVGVAF